LFFLLILLLVLSFLFFLLNPWFVNALSHLVSSSNLCHFCRNGVVLVYNLQCVCGTVFTHSLMELSPS
jgi:hypothetical protein